MSWPYGKSVPGITVEKYLSSFTLNLDEFGGNVSVSVTFAEGRRLASEGVAYVGNWSNGGDYVADEVVYNDGAYWLCLIANGHLDPKEPGQSGSETYWDELDALPEQGINKAANCYHDMLQRSVTLSWPWDDFVTLCGGSTNQGELTDWALIEGIAKFKDAIYDALKAASMEPLPD